MFLITYGLSNEFQLVQDKDELEPALQKLARDPGANPREIRVWTLTSVRVREWTELEITNLDTLE